MFTSNLCKRIIPCLDVANGRTVKGIKFKDLRDVGDPLHQALTYQEQGADEIMFLDIMASVEGRQTTLELITKIAEQLAIPLTVGGGISNFEDASRLLKSGADKVSVNTPAVNRPALITEIANIFGSQCCVLAIDARKYTAKETSNSLESWEVLTHGGRQSTGINAFQWAQQAIELGAGEILLTSWDQDGTLSGFDLKLLEHFAKPLSVPVIASGGAKDPASFVDAFNIGGADAALAATIFHDGMWTVRALKNEIQQQGVPVRLC
jgi:cyclase